MDKSTWKEITILFLVLGAIYTVIQLGAPYLAESFWNGFRNTLGLP